MEEQLIAIRCPFEKRSKTDKEHMYKCNRVCVEVYPGSRGKARCRSCHLFFEFEVDNQAQLSTGIKVKKLDDQESEE